jgi:MscS family membrane protein
LEHLVDLVLGLFDIRSSGNTPTHYAIAALFLVGAVVLRRLVTRLLFGFFRRLAARTRTTLDDKLFPALEAPVGSLIALIGAVAALKVLKLSATGDQTVRYVSTMAFSLVIFWLLLRAFNTLLEHLQGVALERQMGIAAFMPWIRKTLLVVFVVFGILMVAQSLGADVKAFLAGLGIGGLAFALAAQDTLANVFGSVVVAVDQPFKIGNSSASAATPAWWRTSDCARPNCVGRTSPSPSFPTRPWRPNRWSTSPGSPSGGSSRSSASPIPVRRMRCRRSWMSSRPSSSPARRSIPRR